MSFFYALTFFTRIPVPFLKYNDDSWKRCSMWLPAVGLILGLGLSLVHLFVHGILPLWVEAVFITACWLYFTGGLHIDGLMDTGDGLGSYRDPKRMLEIMADSRVGVMGSVTGIIAICFKISLIGSFIEQYKIVILPLLTAPIIARFGGLFVMHIFPHAEDGGLGKVFKDEVTWTRFFLGFIITIIPVFLLSSWGGLIILFLCLVLWLLFGSMIQKKLGGLTGDVYGSFIESTEIVVMILLWIGMEQFRWFQEFFLLG